jgi:hypothetical protein
MLAGNWLPAQSKMVGLQRKKTLASTAADARVVDVVCQAFQPDVPVLYVRLECLTFGLVLRGDLHAAQVEI